MKMDLQLQGKRALVTGSTAGIGFAIAQRLAKEGAAVIVNGRTEKRVEQALSALKKAGVTGKLEGLAADLGTAEGTRTAIARFLPSMMKFGVPTPEAAWAMAAGIPLRSAAVALSTAFLEQVDDPSQRAFLGWLGAIGATALRCVQLVFVPGAEDAFARRGVVVSHVDHAIATVLASLTPC